MSHSTGWRYLISLQAVIQINCLPVAAVLPTSDIKATVYVSYSRRRRDVPRAIEH
jgi:hypothetical protein